MAELERRVVCVAHGCRPNGFGACTLRAALAFLSAGARFCRADQNQHSQKFYRIINRSTDNSQVIGIVILVSE